MTAPATYLRDAADVQAMRLDSHWSFGPAQEWLRAHGVSAMCMGIGEGRQLTIYGPGSRMVARLGDWLTLDMRTAVFAVCTNAEFETAGHKRAGDGE